MFGFSLFFSNAIAATLNLSDRPLSLGSTVEPNIFLVIDDSGSMDWEVLKSSGALVEHGTDDNRDNLDFSPTNTTDKLELCVGYNSLAYNPNVNYIPWSGLDSAGNSYLDQSLRAARNNPFVTAGTRNLTHHYYFPWNDNGDTTYQNGECPIANGDRVFVNALPASQQINYANWYSYYRKREYVAKAAYGSVVLNAQSSRVGMMTLNRNNKVNMPIRSMNANFSTGNKRALMDKLYNINSDNGTPLQNAMYRSGEYLSGRDASWIQAGSSEIFPDPRLSVANGGICQQNFSIVMTDGYYNGDFDFTVGNTDADGAGPWDGGNYADTSSNTLADIAMKYYEEDLNTAATPGVPTNSVDLNTDQHLVTYTVAFGVDGSLACSPGETQDPSGSTCPSSFPGWPAPSSNTRRIDDLRHAAYNGRGLFLSAENPQSLIRSINEAIGNILSRLSSSAGVAFNSTSIQTNTILFQGHYKTSDWSGDLRYLPLGSTGAAGAELASAAQTLDATLPGDRNLITVDTGTGLGVPFRWNAIDVDQQIALGNEDILNYLRGDRSCEISNPLPCPSGNKVLRNRSTALGDIIHSGAAYVAVPNKFYDFDNYAAYQTAKANRTPMAYVGANDGILHGFDASINGNDGTITANAITANTAKEIIGFVPSVIYNRLKNISDPSYIHEYFVDGSPVVGDAYYGGAWHTVLTSGLRSGGQEVFALDVTDPSAFNEANAAHLVLWEFTDANDADLGYTFGKPTIAKMANGKFAAIFGNGYNSTVADGAVGTGEAVLFVIDLQTGLANKISTGVGDLTDPNGLSTPTIVDVDGDFIADFAYAGDLRGNLWRFDLTNNNPAMWKVSFANSPLFAAISPEGNRQNITSPPIFNVRTDNNGYMVYFGTGKYLEQTDNITANQPTQTFYAIWDKWSKETGDSSFVAFDRNSLLQQSIIEEQNINGTDARLTSDNVISWTTHQGWYMDMINTATNDNQGEKLVTEPLLRNGRIFFSTLITNSIICESGGTGWLMVLNAEDGRPLTNSPFDVNNDNVFDDKDNVIRPAGTPGGGGGGGGNGGGTQSVTIAVAGAKSSTGTFSQPTIIEGDSGLIEYVAVSNASGTIGLGDLFGKKRSSVNGSADEIDRGIPFGRILWQQLK